ncbi:MAG: hypothetical protein K2Y29_11580 [Beijerinckiaceae bacterium]|nr:hypothetical protein [Beijerinckiaceae bacterium]
MVAGIAHIRSDPGAKLCTNGQALSKKRPSKHVQPDLVKPVDPAPGLSVEQAAEITRALGVYKRTGNGVAAWVALKACLTYGVPVPDGLADFFLHVANEIQRMGETAGSSDPTGGLPKDRRAEVARLVLGSEAGGGRSVFRRYADILAEQEILALLRTAMVQLILNRSPENAASQSDVFELVADQTGRSYEWVKTFWEEWEQGLGGLKVAAINDALKRGV